MSIVCTRISLVCHPYFTHISSVCHSYVIRMSPVCTRMSSVCRSHVLVCHPYVTRMYSCVIRMSLVYGFIMNRWICLVELFWKKRKLCCHWNLLCLVGIYPGFCLVLGVYNKTNIPCRFLFISKSFTLRFALLNITHLGWISNINKKSCNICLLYGKFIKQKNLLSLRLAITYNRVWYGGNLAPSLETNFFAPLIIDGWRIWGVFQDKFQKFTKALFKLKL